MKRTTTEVVDFAVLVERMTTAAPTTDGGAELLNVTGFVDDIKAMLAYEAVVRVVVPVVFSVIAILGFVGNLSVIIVVVANLQMRSTTNTLIISLAVADHQSRSGGSPLHRHLCPLHRCLLRHHCLAVRHCLVHGQFLLSSQIILLSISET